MRGKDRSDKNRAVGVGKKQRNSETAKARIKGKETCPKQGVISFVLASR
jgi:hypothetical protein